MARSIRSSSAEKMKTGPHNMSPNSGTTQVLPEKDRYLSSLNQSRLVAFPGSRVVIWNSSEPRSQVACTSPPPGRLASGVTRQSLKRSRKALIAWGGGSNDGLCGMLISYLLSRTELNYTRPFQPRFFLNSILI